MPERRQAQAKAVKVLAAFHPGQSLSGAIDLDQETQISLLVEPETRHGLETVANGLAKIGR